MGIANIAERLNFISFILVWIFLTSSHSKAQESGSAVKDEKFQSSYFFYQRLDYPRDCKDLDNECSSLNSSSVYLIKPDGYSHPFEVYCDNKDNIGGWTVIMRRMDGSISFNRNWKAYRDGFGFLSTEFWLGNDKISHLTNQAVYELRIDIILYNGTSLFASFDAFRISDEFGEYKLVLVGVFNGNIVSILAAYSDCYDVYQDGHRQDGVYTILPMGWTGSPFDVFCDMTTAGGGWTLFQRRVDGITDFYRYWDDYKNGFGSVNQGSDFWLGNEKLYYLTNQKSYKLRVDIVTSGGSSKYAEYTSFQVDDNSTNYRLSIGGYSGNAGDGMNFTNDVSFSARNQDYDGCSYHNCAEGHRGAWWYNPTSIRTCLECASVNTYCWNFDTRSRCGNRCSYSNLNGDYNGGNGQNIIWGGNNYCNLNSAEMKLRPYYS